ncbi:hypothetical protein BZB76_0360 [Actinomadura pelletieri DSM 43383]|uniref:Pentapeptide repeat protein n=1 Tax=Actinomadura pelletieri DSM 43383 TaxID=1120940 RepID=A0A495QXS9_9ACTN|nr:hypothetical protein [Actinomadura pelletieri]RKS78922.1 hypothetical protein BZB76_0360 [Actinomadura pelletieri DSM 43383]
MKIVRVATSITVGALSLTMFAAPAMADQGTRVTGDGTQSRDWATANGDRDLRTDGTRVTGDGGLGTDGTRVTGTRVT